MHLCLEFFFGKCERLHFESMIATYGLIDSELESFSNFKATISAFRRSIPIYSTDETGTSLLPRSTRNAVPTDFFVHIMAGFRGSNAYHNNMSEYIWPLQRRPRFVDAFWSHSYSSRHPSILSDNGKHHGSGHVVLSPVKARLEWPLQGASLGKGIWRPCAAHTTRPPSRPHWSDPRECRAIHLGSAWLQELPEGSHHRHPAAWGTPLLICILDLLP